MIENYLIEHDFALTPFLMADCLIIGAGAAGLSAAIEASKYGRVLVLAKREFTHSNTNAAQGGVATVLSKSDNFEKHIKDTLVAGANFCNKKAVTTLVKEGPKCVKELIKWGANFDKSNKGSIKFTREGGHGESRIIHAGGDATGKEIQSILFKKASNNPNIKILQYHFVVDLLHHKNQCYGALALNTKDGNKKIGVLAKQIIIATGGAGCTYQDTTNPSGATGDGPVLAFRAGAKLINLEFMQFHPTTLYIAGAPRFLISEAVRGEGAILRDEKGNAFMSKYHPLQDLAPRDIVSKAITDVMIERSLNHVYLDLRHLDQSYIHKRFPNITDVCTSFNINLSKDMIPVRPSAHYHMGGIKVDINGKSDVKNLYACGEAACTGCHGANRLASNSLLEALVFGKRAGEMLKNHLHQQVIGFPLDSISKRNTDIDSSEVDFNDIQISARNIMWKKSGIYRDKDSLLKAYQKLKEWDKTISLCKLERPEHFEVANIVTLAQLITYAATIREESRGSHQRSDFPFESNVWRTKTIEIDKVSYSKRKKK